ncbi:MAG: DeoR family transcriptional regulator [Edaphobacter sp.]
MMTDLVSNKSTSSQVPGISGEPTAEAIRMLIGERRNHILSLVHRDGRALVSKLSESLSISPITIRKDLDYLGVHGVVHRTHGAPFCLRAAP